MDPVIQLQDFRKTYKSGEVEVHAVRGVNLTILPGEFVAIMGASGSGKSTMMNTLGCLDRPTSGKFLLDGVEIGKLNRDEPIFATRRSASSSRVSISSAAPAPSTTSFSPCSTAALALQDANKRAGA